MLPLWTMVVIISQRIKSQKSWDLMPCRLQLYLDHCGIHHFQNCHILQGIINFTYTFLLPSRLWQNMPPIQFICNQIMLLWEAALKFVFETVQGFSGLKSRISFYALKFQIFDSRLFAFQIRHLIVICFEFSYFHSVINVSCSGFSYFHTATKMWPAEDFYISWTYDGLSLIVSILMIVIRGTMVEKKEEMMMLMVE